MKIALFVHNCPPEFLGGTEQVALALAHAYESIGDDVVVIAGSERHVAGGTISEETWQGLRVRRVIRDTSEHYGLDLAWPVTGDRVTELLADERPDAVHLHHWSTLGQDVLRRAAALGIRSGATLHDLWTTCPRFFRRPPNSVRCPLEGGRDECVACVRLDMTAVTPDTVRSGIAKRDAELRRELAAATFVAVPSAAQAALVRKHLPWHRPLEVVPHGLLETVAERAEPRGKDVPLRVGTFGNLVPEKGIDMIVEALSNFGDAVEVRLSGSAPDPSYVERIGARARSFGLPFVWTGPYGPDDPHPALELDLAIFPSHCYESYGLVVDEALSRGVPVVVSSRGAFPERAALGGVVVRSGGILPLKVALAGVLLSRRKLGELRDAIPAEFPTIEDAARRYRSLLGLEVAR